VLLLDFAKSDYDAWNVVPMQSDNLTAVIRIVKQDLVMILDKKPCLGFEPPFHYQKFLMSFTLVDEVEVAGCRVAKPT